MTSEREFRQLAEIECARRGWERRDPTWVGYKRRNQRFPRTYDLFGFIDLVAGRDGKTYAIQFTSAGNHATRRKKVLAHENLAFVRSLGWTVLIWSWRWKGQEAVLREEEVRPE